MAAGIENAAEKPKAAVRGKPWKKGEAPKGGRPKGSRNKRTLEGIAFFADVLKSKEWQQSARARIVAGTAPHLEKYGVEICFGKPKDRVEVSGGMRFSIVPGSVPDAD